MNKLYYIYIYRRRESFPCYSWEVWTTPGSTTGGPSSTTRETRTRSRLWAPRPWMLPSGQLPSCCCCLRRTETPRWTYAPYVTYRLFCICYFTTAVVCCCLWRKHCSLVTAYLRLSYEKGIVIYEKIVLQMK